MSSDHFHGEPVSILRRPRSLAEVARTAVEYGDIDPLLREFLDEFYCEMDPGARLSMLQEEPMPAGSAKADAYLAAVAEHLSRVQELMMEVTLSAAPRQTSTRFTQHARLAKGVVLTQLD